MTSVSYVVQWDDMPDGPSLLSATTYFFCPQFNRQLRPRQPCPVYSRPSEVFEL